MSRQFHNEGKRILLRTLCAHHYLTINRYITATEIGKWIEAGDYNY